MRELKRTLCAPRLWGLLALLLALNIMLLVVEDTRNDGFYARYNEILAGEPDAGALRAEIDGIQAEANLLTWSQQPEGFFREMLAETCAENYGADFAERWAAGTLRVDEASVTEGLYRQEAIQAVLDQLEYLNGYQDYLDTVHANAKQMAALAIFNKENSFSDRNIKKTNRDFPRELTLTLGNDYAVTMLCTDQLGGYSLLVFVLALVVSFLVERKKGLWSLMHSAPRGRGRLALRRSALLLLGSVLGVAVLLGGKLLAAVLLYGGIGPLDRPVQSLEAFSAVPWALTVRQYLLLYFPLRAAGIWLVSLVIYAILQAVNYLPLAFGALGAALAAEYSLFRWIPDSYSIVILRYVNVFALVDVPSVSLKYLNLNLFGQPVQGVILTIVLLPLLLAAGILGNCLLAERKKPVARQNSLLVFADQIRRPFSRAVGRLPLFGQELYKLLWLQRGVAVLLLFALFLFGSMETPRPDTELYDTQGAGIAASLQGPITERTLDAIDAQLAEYAGWEQSDALLEQVASYEALRARVEESLRLQDGKWLISAAPLAALFNKNGANYQRENAVVLLLALVLLLSALFAQDSQTKELLRAAPRGGRTLLWKKLGAACLLTVLLWAVFEARELSLILRDYGTPAWAAPVQSFDYFAGSGAGWTLGMQTAIFLMQRLLGLLTAAGIVCLISALCRQSNTAILCGAAVLVLPACLSCMGLKTFDVSCVLLSPLECPAGGYIAAAALLLLLPFVISRVWMRRRA